MARISGKADASESIAAGVRLIGTNRHSRFNIKILDWKGIHG